MFALFCLVSCKSDAEGEKSEDTTEGETIKIYEPDNDIIDSDGKLILKSNNDRYVYKDGESEYTIVLFGSDLAVAVYDVFVLETAADANEHYLTVGAEGVTSGEYATTEIYDNVVLYQYNFITSQDFKGYTNWSREDVKSKLGSGYLK